MHRLMKSGLAVIVGGALSLAGAAPALAAAGGSVSRYQVTTYTIRASIFATHNHVYTATDNPCTTGPGVFSGTGTGETANTGVLESITGTLSGRTLTYHAVYTSVPLGFSVKAGYSYTVTATVTFGTGSFSGTATDSLGGSYAISGTISMSTTSYTNHGQYVKSQGGGSTAAHSCIGMPMQA